mmetsp:Transcript_38137/g.85412  ORF Transcript_38137/g.85412 Transcript_38137/m.85412 type:complete len:109 (+) Transcript_38137:102-428(+)
MCCTTAPLLEVEEHLCLSRLRVVQAVLRNVHCVPPRKIGRMGRELIVCGGCRSGGSLELSQAHDLAVAAVCSQSVAFRCGGKLVTAAVVWMSSGQCCRGLSCSSESIC